MYVVLCIMSEVGGSLLRCGMLMGQNCEDQRYERRERWIGIHLLKLFSLSA